MKIFSFSFGTGNPSVYSGLSPTFTLFANLSTGATLSPPAVSEILTGSGMYKFQYEPINQTPIIFLIDGGSAITADSDRYVRGELDTIQQVDQVVGFTNSAFGSTASDPVDMFGFIKRLQEFLEGDSVFTKSTGIWDVQTRGGTALISKILTNSTTSVTKV